MSTVEAKILSPEGQRIVAVPKFEQLYIGRDFLPQKVTDGERTFLWQGINTERLLLAFSRTIDHFRESASDQKAFSWEEEANRDYLIELVRLKCLVDANRHPSQGRKFGISLVLDETVEKINEINEDCRNKKSIDLKTLADLTLKLQGRLLSEKYTKRVNLYFWQVFNYYAETAHDWLEEEPAQEVKSE